VHEHLMDERLETLRPKAAQPAEQQNVLGTAAAAGRADVLGAQGVLGLQRAVGNAGVATLMEEERSPVHDVISSGGRPLDTEVRTDMESRLGHDFSDVRVHDDSHAADSAAAVNAHAYTVGSNIVFRDFDPSSTDGRTTLAHELTHVVQQRSGPVDGTSAPGGIKVSDPGDRFETEAAANADRAMSAPAPAAEVATSGPALQREPVPDEAVEDEEAVQGLFVQRQGEEEEQEEPVQGLFVQRETAEEEEEAPA
jgi:hypothetical protein